MKGFRVKIILTGSHPEISREVILPEKINFRDLDWVICELFSLKDRGSSAFCLNFDRESFFNTDDYLLKKYIEDKIYFNYRFDSKLIFEITLNESIDYDLNYVSLIDFKGEFNPAEDVHVSALNNMMLKGIDFEKFNPKKTQKELKKIQILKNKAFDIKITQISRRNVIWRDFIVPERTTFAEIEDLILITFDTSPVSFGHDDKTVDYYFKSRIPIYSKNGEFKIDVKGKVYSKKSFTVLKKYSGGENPFDLWHEYYPKVERDKAQSYLDDFI